jgi:hypothetical protein
MKKYYKLFLLVFLGFNVSSVFAVTVVVPDQMIKEIINHKIEGLDMVGMQVSVDGASTSAWDGTPDSSSDWELAYAGTDTLNGFWTFTNNSSTQVNTVTFDAFGANAVFDWKAVTGPESTEGSEAGNFSNSGPAEHEFTGPVKIAGSSAPVGDLYRWLTFDFTGVGGLSDGDSFTFIIDSDEIAPVPLPPAVVLLFSGLLSLAGLGYRQKS